ncbi:MAG: penicillin-binding protein 2 [Firmicutes bacterium]|jgi:penicillin-binding protein 2|nr:penicillin-binding protein 2 [Bacillota bacterium]
MSIMDAMDRAQQTGTERRVHRFQILVVILFMVLAARLWQLQVVQGEYYVKRATENRLALLPISAPRGVIVDRNGEVLASNRMAYTVSAVPGEFRGADEELELLSSLIDMSPEDIRSRIAEQTQGRLGVPYQPARLVEDASVEVVLRVSEHRVELPGIIIEEEPYRSYPKGDLAGQVIGYVGQINAEELKQLASAGYRARDRIGKTGLERAYEHLLKGVDGETQVEVDSLSRPRGTLGTVEPVAGASLELTIDAGLQQAAELAIEEQLRLLKAEGKYTSASAGAAVVLDARTGEVLALASEPGYDPGWFVPRISEERWRSLNSPVSALFNRAVSGAYPPGSVFKPFTAVAALQAGVVNLNERILCSPSVADDYTGKRCHVWSSGRSHGWQTLLEGMANSCNIVFYELGKRLTADQMANAARMFGFSRTTGLDLVPAEAAGVVPGSETRTFMPGERLSYAIGQQVTVTPLQLAVAYAGIATRGTLYAPYLVSRAVAADGEVLHQASPTVSARVELPDRVWNYLRDSLTQVVKAGTAARAYSGFPIPVAGKTGSAQAPPGDAHGWFVGWAPIDEPEIVVAVLIERGGAGGTAAAPVARRIMECYFADRIAEMGEGANGGPGAGAQGSGTYIAPPTD